MSSQRSATHSQIKLTPSEKPGLMRWPFYVAGAVVVLLGLAWFDAGEKPIRPIVQSVAVPVASGGSE